MRLLLAIAIIAVVCLFAWLRSGEETTRQRRDAQGVEQELSRTEGSGDFPPINRSAPTGTSRDPASSSATVPGTADRPPPPALQVWVRDDLGDPVAKVRIALHQESREYDARVTAENGFARFPASYRSHTLVYLDRGSRKTRHLIGIWDGQPGAKRLEATMFRRRNVLLRVLVDGEPGFPAGFTLRYPVIEGMQRFDSSGEVRGQLVSFTRDVEIVPEADAQYLADQEQFMLKDRGGILEATLEYETGVPVELHVRKSDMGEDLRFETQQDDGTWGTPFGWPEGPICNRCQASRRIRLGLRAGNHRLVLHALELPIREFTVAREDSPVRLDLRRSRLDWVEVRYDVPEAYRRASRIGVTVSGKDVPEGLRVVGEETKFLHPGDRALELTVSGAGLQPHPKRGVRKLSRGGRVRLKAVAGAAATVRCPGSQRVKLTLHARTSPFEVEYSAIGTALAGGVFAFRNIPAGVFHVVVAPDRSAPTLIESVGFADTATRLGTIESGAGEELAIRYSNRGGNPVAVRATWLPIEKRLNNAARMQGDEASMSGLPPGNVRLDFKMSDHKWSRVVTTSISGKSTIEVDCAGD